MGRLPMALLLALASVAASCEASSTPRPSPALTPNGSGAPFDPSSNGAPATPSASAANGSLPVGTPSASRGPAPGVALERVATVAKALDIANPHDGSGRLFVATQAGQIVILAGGSFSATPLLDLGGRISSGGERGLLGLAFHPRFPAEPRLFVDYTDRNGNTVVSSFRASGEPVGAAVDAASERILLRVTQPYANHNGGGLAFGPDGFLYIALGDGGSAGDPQGNGQRLDTLLGKILRIDVDQPRGEIAYGIPSDNPYAGGTSGRPEIWLSGLRNPFRFSFDRQTGDLWIGDVGQGSWEEVDVLRAGSAGGQNLGWNRMEGLHCYPAGANCSTSGLLLPVTEYSHGPACSVTGGAVYRGAAWPALSGRYLFADYCSGELFSVDATVAGRQEPQRVGRTSTGIAGFGADDAGELYLANVSDGSISRLVVAP